MPTTSKSKNRVSQQRASAREEQRQEAAQAVQRSLDRRG